MVRFRPATADSTSQQVRSRAFPRRIRRILGAVAAGNLLVWTFTFLVFRTNGILLSTAVMAYMFGLRHALDADHIAAIDNSSRKLFADGREPYLTGFYFSLGHSTIVVVLSALVAAGVSAIRSDLPAFQLAGEWLGTAVSVIFLLGIAAANLLVLRKIIQARLIRGTGPNNGEYCTIGPLTGLLRPLLRGVRQDWHLYPIGILFGLGFDTATEIGVLGIAAAASLKHLPIWSIMLFPALFTAGMTLLDTADGVLMCRAYGWAAIQPGRKWTYNMIMTLVSIFLAAGVALLEVLGIAQAHWRFSHGLWNWIRIANSGWGWEIVGLAAGSLFMLIFLIFRIWRRKPLPAG